MNPFLIVSISLLAFLPKFSEGQQYYQVVSVNLHNEYRNKHQVGPLSLSDDLNTRAETCAQYYADKGAIDNSCREARGFGQNLWAQNGGFPTDDDAANSSASLWYSKEPQHDYSKDYQRNTGVFTQMVWKGSSELGFGVGRRGRFVVGCALYNPQGNYVGEFRRNVFPPKASDETNEQPQQPCTCCPGIAGASRPPAEKVLEYTN